MRKKLLLLCLSLISLSYASLLGSINSLFDSGHGRHRHRPNNTQQINDSSEASFKQFCKSIPAQYGFQIRCERPNIQTRFKADASATVKCSQIYAGVNKTYPQIVTLSDDFISNLHLCSGKKYGPFQVDNTIISAESASNYHQANSNVTYYDIVCDGSKASYESNMYLTMQAKQNALINQHIEECLDQIPQPQARKFVIMFYICVGLALISFAMIAYRNYKNKKSKN